jgi:hypothetical protein
MQFYINTSNEDMNGLSDHVGMFRLLLDIAPLSEKWHNFYSIEHKINIMFILFYSIIFLLRDKFFSSLKIKQIITIDNEHNIEQIIDIHHSCLCDKVKNNDYLLIVTTNEVGVFDE